MASIYPECLLLEISARKAVLSTILAEEKNDMKSSEQQCGWKTKKKMTWPIVKGQKLMFSDQGTGFVWGSHQEKWRTEAGNVMWVIKLHLLIFLQRWKLEQVFLLSSRLKSIDQDCYTDCAGGTHILGNMKSF